MGRERALRTRFGTETGCAVRPASYRNKDNNKNNNNNNNNDNNNRVLLVIIVYV